MSAAFDRLTALVSEVVDLRHASSLLGWDERVCMPPGGVAVHGDMVATIQRLAHQKFTSSELGDLIAASGEDFRSLPDDSAPARVLKVTARDHERATRVSSEYVFEHAQVVSAAHEAWQKAREQSDFSIFLPHLARVVKLKQQYVDFFPAVAHPYDALVEDYEPGILTSDIQAIFDGLRPRQVELVRTIQQHAAAAPINDGFLHGSYAEQEMLRFACEVISTFGFDWKRGRQDKSAHPFAIPIGCDDVRITTRFSESHPFETLFSTMHECGHALYEQGVSPGWSRTLAEGGASLGVHESQSRLWENLIGRSLPFWQHFFPLLRRRFAGQLDDVPLEAFYRAINRVQPSLIRVEADEVTYNLHVMLRVEIEIALLTGAVSAKDAPAFWDEKMREYLGVVPDSAKNGILQDMHWSIGLFGYFATYTLGNLISVQLWRTFVRDEPGWEEQIRRGDFERLGVWLRTSLHQHGRSREPRDLVQEITGGPISTEPYLDYLEAKYREIYCIASL